MNHDIDIRSLDKKYNYFSQFLDYHEKNSNFENFIMQRPVLKFLPSIEVE